MLGASRIPVRPVGTVRPCTRCGLLRETHTKGRSGLCRDCRSVLTVEERGVWT